MFDMCKVCGRKNRDRYTDNPSINNGSDEKLLEGEMERKEDRNRFL